MFENGVEGLLIAGHGRSRTQHVARSRAVQSGGVTDTKGLQFRACLTKQTTRKLRSFMIP